MDRCWHGHYTGPFSDRLSFLLQSVRCVSFLAKMANVNFDWFPRKRGSWIWAAADAKQSGSPGNNKKRSVNMAPPNIPLPPTPQTQFTSPVGHQPAGHLQPLPVSLNGTSIYASTNDIYEHLPGENHHMYDLTYEDTQSTRKRTSPTFGADVRPRSPPPSPPTGVTVNGVTINGFVMN